MFKVGDKVTSNFHCSDSAVIRTITRCERNEKFGSGYSADADGGAVCEHCGHTAQIISDIDAAWFKAA